MWVPLVVLAVLSIIGGWIGVQTMLREHDQGDRRPYCGTERKYAGFAVAAFTDGGLSPARAPRWKRPQANLPARPLARPPLATARQRRAITRHGTGEARRRLGVRRRHRRRLRASTCAATARRRLVRISAARAGSTRGFTAGCTSTSCTSRCSCGRRWPDRRGQCAAFDQYVVDGVVNGVGWLGEGARRHLPAERQVRRGRRGQSASASWPGPSGPVPAGRRRGRIRMYVTVHAAGRSAGGAIIVVLSDGAD